MDLELAELAEKAAKSLAQAYHLTSSLPLRVQLRNEHIAPGGPFSSQKDGLSFVAF